MNTWPPTRRPVAVARPGTGHPNWCAGGHHCGLGLGEHRAAPVRLGIPGRASTALTRVLAADGRQHVEITTSVALAAGDGPAREHLARILTELDAHLQRLARRDAGPT